MPSLELYKKALATKGANVGIARKTHSDLVMEATWNSDIQSKVCYIYDYFHDDKPWLASNITHENTTKTRIDAKFIVTQYGSISKDQVEFHLMFKPSQKMNFTVKDELWWYERDFHQKYGAEFPIGAYIDIPDDKGIYKKWLVCRTEYGNQFIKYSVLPCNYYLHWIEVKNNARLKRKMWCVARSQNSYNSGIWNNYNFDLLDNVDIIWLPMNSLTEYLYYTVEDGKNTRNMRLIVSAPIKHPNVWKISKVENHIPFGLQRLTLKQDAFNSKTDYVNLTTKEMYANYYSSVEHDHNEIQKINLAKTPITAFIHGSEKMRNGYKRTYSAIFLNSDGKRITDLDFEWTIDGDIKVEHEIIRDDIALLVDNEDYIGEKIKLQIILSNEIVATKEIEIVEMF